MEMYILTSCFYSLASPGYSSCTHGSSGAYLGIPSAPSWSSMSTRGIPGHAILTTAPLATAATAAALLPGLAQDRSAQQVPRLNARKHQAQVVSCAQQGCMWHA